LTGGTSDLTVSSDGMGAAAVGGHADAPPEMGVRAKWERAEKRMPGVRKPVRLINSDWLRSL
jgi:hypothetical protein